LFLKFNFEEAPVPEHYYVADWFDIEERDLQVVISFGNRDKKGQLRSRIDIVFPAYTFVRHLWESSREFHVTLARFAESFQLNGAEKCSAELVTDKLQTLVSNAVVMVFSGMECLMDFFYISPKDMWSKPRKGEQLELEAVVRVLVSPILLLGFLNASQPIVTHLTDRFPAILGKEDHVENLESQHAG
jgi:hypothetical protein